MSKTIVSGIFAVTLVTASASTFAQAMAVDRLGVSPSKRDFGVSPSPSPSPAPRQTFTPPPVSAPTVVPRAPVIAAPVYVPPPPPRAPVVAPVVVPGVTGGIQPGVVVQGKSASGYVSGPDFNPATMQQPIVPAVRAGIGIPGDAPAVPRDPTKPDPSAPPAAGSAEAPRR